MGDGQTVDMSWYLDGTDVSLPTRMARLEGYFGSITEAATAWPYPGLGMFSTVRCRRRPGRRSCEGHLRVIRVELPRQIVWFCPDCEDHGVIAGWSGTEWDLSAGDDDPRHTDRLIDVEITDVEHRALRKNLSATRGIRRTVAAAQHFLDAVVLWGTHPELEALSSLAIQHAVRAERHAHRRLLADVSLKVREVSSPGG